MEVVAIRIKYIARTEKQIAMSKTKLAQRKVGKNQSQYLLILIMIYKLVCVFCEGGVAIIIIIIIIIMIMIIIMYNV